MNAVADKVAEIVAGLVGTYENSASPTSVAERVAAWIDGGTGDADEDERIGFAWGCCCLIATNPAAQFLYQLHVSRDYHGRLIGPRARAAVTAWADGEAAGYASGFNARKRPRVPSYSVAWGRQAGRDGAWMALWPELPVPGVNARTAVLGGRDEAYLRIRRAVQSEAKDLIDSFGDDMAQAYSGRFGPDFRRRYVDATGRWPYAE